MNIRNKAFLLIPAFWASIFDIAVTIYHQPATYWSGNLKHYNEGNPIGAFFMSNHVYGLFLICGIWLVLIYIIGKSLKGKAQKIFLLFVVIAHSFGASTWISSRYGFWFAMLLIAFNSSLYIFINENSQTPTKIAH
ncbi:hypothetical protein [Echinicola vietnamensis]|uniref:DUF5658 domain-containing protein n=1 Tax=Echinicola vietnamensis (strain DSM 17526 / LMG 23754 / KMM 6221) TaxID=926556 RepID=L0FV09_ECHVK|nr:hypothetical protein [Echinicola vietnamensis]AGA76581.1 hypothetical protein Echvi_0290 [Echinicola vietnamensis DSM 17526]